MSVFVSLSESPFRNSNFSGCTVHVVRQKEQHVAIFLIDRVNQVSSAGTYRHYWESPTVFKKNLNASKPSNQSKGLDGNIGCRDKLVQKVKSALQHVVLAPWRSGPVEIFYIPL